MPQKKPLKTIILIPTFNEESKIEKELKRFKKKWVDTILVIDDHSTDSTIKLVKKFKKVKYIVHSKRIGVGAVFRTGIDYALKHKYDIILCIAGNDKDRPHEIPRLLKPIIKNGYDFVQGSRFLPGGKCGNTPWYRIIATRFIHPLIFSICSGKKVTESTNGFRAFRASLFKDKRINLWQNWLNKYELEPYLYMKTIQLGYKTTEVPVTKIYPTHKLGYTKMKPLTDWWSIIKPLIYLKFGIKK